MVKSVEKDKNGYALLLEMAMPEGTKKKNINDNLTINIKDHPDDAVKVHCYGRPKTVRKGRSPVRVKPLSKKVKTRAVKSK